jgi:hypothetical protein
MIAFPKIGKKSRSRKSWKDACLRLWGEAIRLRAGGRCQRCGKEASLDAHHIIPRGTSPHMGWFDPNNGVALCFQCHRVHGPHSLDIDEQIAFRSWVAAWLKGRSVDYEILKIKCKSRDGGRITEFEYQILRRLLIDERNKARGTHDRVVETRPGSEGSGSASGDDLQVVPGKPPARHDASR